MVVAGPEVAVGLEAIGLLPDDQRHLGVGLQRDEAVDHLHARALEVACPADVALLVEPGLELHQCRYRLAGVGSLDQGRHDRAILAGAVERLLDRHHVRVARRLLDELHHHLEALVRMVDDEILVADGGEAIAAEVLDAFRKARRVGGEQQVGAILRDHLRHVGQAQDAVHLVDVVGVDAEMGDQEGAELLGHRRIDAQADHIAEPPPLEHRLEQADEVFRLLLDLDVAVAQDPEEAASFALEARKEELREGEDELLEPDEARMVARQADEPLELAGQEHETEQALALAAIEFHHHADAAVGNEREGVGRVDRDRGEDGDRLVVEALAQELQVLVGELRDVEHGDVLLAQRPGQLVPPALLDLG